MKLSRDIQTVSELKQNASKLIKQVNETRQPIVLTINGKPAAVIQDVESYERMAEAADYELTIRALREAQDERSPSPSALSARRRRGLSRGRRFLQAAAARDGAHRGPARACQGCRRTCGGDGHSI